MNAALIAQVADEGSQNGGAGASWLLFGGAIVAIILLIRWNNSRMRRYKQDRADRERDMRERDPDMRQDEPTDD